MGSGQPMASKSTSPRRKRSAWTWLLAAIFLALGLLGWLRVQQAIAFWGMLAQLKAWPGPFYIAAGGALWGALGIAAAWGVWRPERWGAVFGRAAALVLAATWWIDRLWLSPGAGAFSGWPFALGVTAVWIGFVFFALARFGKRTRPPTGT
jgi:hypothetical protein